MTDSAPGPGGLVARSVSGLLWSGAGTVFRTVLQIGTHILLARLLGPENFGLFALSLVVVAFTAYFADVGLAYGLIQRPSVTDRDVRFVFTWQVTLSGALTAALVLGSDGLSHLVGDPRVGPVLAWLSLACLFGALGTTAEMLLRRAMDYRALNIASVSGYVIGFIGIGLPMALAGYGVASLVTAHVAQTLVKSLLQLGFRRHALRPLFVHADARGFFTFGLTALATNLQNWVLTNLDRLVVGRAFGVGAAGLYSTMVNLILSPSMQLADILHSVLYSASARVQNDLVQVGRAFKAAAGLVMLLLAPAFLSIAVVADTFVHALYGERWQGGALVLAPIAAAMPGYLLMTLSVPALWVSGRIHTEFRQQLPVTAFWLAALALLAANAHLAALSWAVCGLFYLRAGVIVRAALARTSVHANELLRTMLPGWAVTAWVAAVAAGADGLLGSLGASPVQRLVAIVGACAVALAAGLWYARGYVTADTALMLRALAARLPSGWTRRWVGPANNTLP